MDRRPAAISNADSALQSRIGSTLRELAHEFGNLVFPLQMILELQAHAAPLSPDEFTRLLRGHIEEMTVLTARFRIVGRYLAGHIESCWSELRSDDLVHSAQELCRFPRQAEHAVRFDLSAAPPTIPGDREQLQQGLAELIDNALRFSPAESEVVVSVQRRGGTVEFDVADSGPGIAPELQSQLFDPFVYGSRKLDFATGQLGCGLAIVQRVAEVHQGTAELRCTSQAGSHFSLCIPAERSL